MKQKLFIIPLVCFLSYAYSDLVYEACKDNVPEIACFDCTDPVMSQFCQFTCKTCVNIKGTQSSVSNPFGQPKSGIKYLIKYSDSITEDCFFGTKINDNIVYCNPINGEEFFLVDVPSTFYPTTEFRPSSSTADSFYTQLNMNFLSTDKMLLGQFDGYPTTVIVTYKVFNLLNVISLNFKISDFDFCSNFNTLTVRLYLLLSYTKSFKNVFIDLQNMLYDHSKWYLSNEQFRNLYLTNTRPKNIDLLKLYNSVLKRYNGLVNYIGIIMMPEYWLNDNSYCKVDKSHITLDVHVEIAGKDVTRSVNLESSISFNTAITSNSNSYITFGPKMENYPSTSLFAFYFDTDSYVDVSSLIFKISVNCYNFYKFMRVYLLVSENNLFNNTYAGLKKTLYNYSWLFLTNKPFMYLFLRQGDNSIDLVNLFNNAKNNYPLLDYIRYYIGVIVIFDDILNGRAYCETKLNQVSLVLHGKVWKGAVSFKSAIGDKYLRHQNMVIKLDSFVLPIDRSFYVHQKDSYISIQVANPNYLSNYIGKHDDHFDIARYAKLPAFTLIVIGLTIKDIVSINRYSVNVTINSSFPLWTLLTYSVIKYKDPNGVVKLYPVANYSTVISSLQSYTLYTFSAGVKNEFGFIVYEAGMFSYQTDEDVPAGYPRNFTVIRVNFTTLFLSWDTVESSMRKGIISNYSYSCHNTEDSVSDKVDNSTFNVTVYILNPDANYNCSLAACSKVGCGVQAFVFNNTLAGIPGGYPQNFTVIRINFTTLFLSWAPVEISTRKGNILNYIYSCHNAEDSVSNKVDNSTFNVTVNILNPDANYNCSLAACSKVGCGVQAIVFNNTLVDNSIPGGYPCNFSVKIVNFTTMFLSWAEVECTMRKGIISSYIYSCYSTEDIVSNTVDKCTFNATLYNLNPDVIYNCSIAVCNKVGCGIQAFVFNITLVGIPSGPPLNFAVKPFDFSSLLLSWDIVEYSKTNGTIIAYQYSCSNMLNTWNTVDNDTFEYIVDNLTFNTTYNCTVAACTRVGCGVHSSLLATTLEGLPQECAEITYISSINSSSINVSWNGNSILEWGVQENQSFCLDIENSSQIIQIKCVDYVMENYNININGLEPYTNYTVLVYAKNKAGIGIKDNDKRKLVQTDEFFPTGFPLNFTVAKVNFTTLLLSWDNVEYSMRNGIIIKYFYSCNNTEVCFSSLINNAYNVTVSDIDPDKLYTCSVAACTKVGCGVNVTTLVETSWSQWGSWTSCNNSFGFVNRTRECHLFYSTRWCRGNNVEVDQCSERWAMWSKCSVTCGVGNRTRQSLQGKPIIKVESCKPIDCPVDGIWGNWVPSNCSTTCGIGIITHKRICKEPLFNGRDCIGVANYTDVCDTGVICPVNGNFSKWSLWSLCNQPCGGGMKSRFRSCSNPYPMFGGQGCNGNSTEFESCNQQSCKSVDLNLKVNFVDNDFYDILALEELLQAAILNIYSSYKVNGSFRVVIHSIDISW